MHVYMPSRKAGKYCIRRYITLYGLYLYAHYKDMPGSEKATLYSSFVSSLCICIKGLNLRLRLHKQETCFFFFKQICP